MKKRVGVALLLMLISICLAYGCAEDELTGTWKLIHYYDENGDDIINEVSYGVGLIFDENDEMTMYYDGVAGFSQFYHYDQEQSAIVVKDNFTSVARDGDILTVYERNTLVFQRVSDATILQPIDNEQVNELMARVQKIGNITDEIWAYLDSQGISDYYGEAGRVMAYEFLTSRDDVMEVWYASSGVAFRTMDGWIGGFLSEEYENGYLGSGESESLIRLQGNPELFWDIGVDPLLSMKNKNVRLLLFNSSERNMNAIWDLDCQLLQAYAEDNGYTFDAAADIKALHTIQAGTYADSGLLVIAAHGSYIERMRSGAYINAARVFIEISTYDEDLLRSELNRPYFRRLLDEVVSTDTLMLCKIKGQNAYRLQISSDMLQTWGYDLQFDDTVVVLGICYANADEKLYRFFMERGARAVIFQERMCSIYQHFLTLAAITDPAGPEGSENALYDSTRLTQVFSVDHPFKYMDDYSERMKYATQISDLYSAYDPDPESELGFDERLASSWWEEETKISDRITCGPMRIWFRNTR